MTQAYVGLALDRGLGAGPCWIWLVDGPIGKSPRDIVLAFLVLFCYCSPAVRTFLRPNLVFQGTIVK